MTQCEWCGKNHRTEEAIGACKAKAERAAARAEKKQAEVDRREAIQRAMPPGYFICHGLRLGTSWGKIVAGLRKDYPGQWDLVSVVDFHTHMHPGPPPGMAYVWPEERISIGVLQEWYGEKVQAGEVETLVKPLDEVPPPPPEPEGLSEDDLRWWRYKAEKGWL